MVGVKANFNDHAFQITHTGQSLSYINLMRSPVFRMNILGSKVAVSTQFAFPNPSHRPELPKFPIEDVQNAFKLVSDKFNLNLDQSSVLQSVSEWFLNKSTSNKENRTILVHGVFGSGIKSN